jgi:hypothetical protein
MTSADFYRQQAELLLSWAAAANDAVVKEQLRKRAEEYLTLAARLEQAEPSSDRPDTGKAQPPRGREPHKCN